MKRFLTSLLVVGLMCSLAVPAQALIDPTNQWPTHEEEIAFWPDPNENVTLPALPNSKTIRFAEGIESVLQGTGRVLPITFSECTYEDYTAPGSVGFASQYTNVTIKTGGSVRTDFTRGTIFLIDTTAPIWERYTSGYQMVNMEDVLEYSLPDAVSKFGVSVSNNNHIGYVSDFAHYIYGKGLTWTFNKPGTYYLYVGDRFAYYMKVKLKVEGPEVTTPTTPTTPTQGTVTANPTTSKVMVNGKSVAFEAYNINNNNYFKLRDIALALRGTSKQFEVTWNGNKNAIEILSNKAYTVVGGELKVSNSQIQSAKLSTANVYLDGNLGAFTAYNINSNNFFKLRDLGKALNFGVSWDSKNSCVVIDTTVGYTEQ